VAHSLDSELIGEKEAKKVKKTTFRLSLSALAQSMFER
jgi:hypothetical protein